MIKLFEAATIRFFLLFAPVASVARLVGRVNSGETLILIMLLLFLLVMVVNQKWISRILTTQDCST